MSIPPPSPRRRNQPEPIHEVTVQKASNASETQQEASRPEVRKGWCWKCGEYIGRGIFGHLSKCQPMSNSKTESTSTT